MAAAPRPIQAVDRALRLLAEIGQSESALSTGQLAERAGVNRSTAWRLLATLEAHRLVDRDPLAGGYRLGVGAVRLASRVGAATVARRVRPTLEWLSRETGEAAQLTLPEAGGLRVVDEVLGPAVLTVRWLDRLLPLETSSVGKLLYALRPASELEALLVTTPVVDAERFRAGVDEARRTGIGTSVGEHDVDVNGYSSAVVEHGTPVAFLSVSGPAARVPLSRLPELAPRLLEAADRAAKALGMET